MRKTQNLQDIWNTYIHVNLKYRKQRRLQPPPYTWIFISTLTMESLLLGLRQTR